MRLGNTMVSVLKVWIYHGKTPDVPLRAMHNIIDMYARITMRAWLKGVGQRLRLGIRL